jgi:hypothetical protein
MGLVTDVAWSSGATERGAVLVLEYAASPNLLVADPATGGARKFLARGLGSGDPPVHVAAVAKEIVYYGRGTGGPAVYAFDGQRSRRVARGWYFVPSSSAERVWVALLDRRSPKQVRALRGVREMTLRGRLTAPARHRPPEGTVVGAVEEGLVIEASQMGKILVWNPRKGEVVRAMRGDITLAIGRDLIAWCRTPCTTANLTDLTTFATTRLPHSRGVQYIRGGSVSSGQGHLALPVRIVTSDELSVLLFATRGRVGVQLETATPLDFGIVTTWDPALPWVYVADGTGKVAAFEADGHKLCELSLDKSTAEGAIVGLAAVRPTLQWLTTAGSRGPRTGCSDRAVDSR